MLFLGLVFFVILILVHEFGHFIVARRNGVKVEEFGVGFPPKLIGKRFKKGDTEYTINLLPLGGFVRLKGENEADKSEGSLGATSYWSKTKIMFAGVAMNFLTAAVLLTGLALVGMPNFVDNQFSVDWDSNVVDQSVAVGSVEDGSPASDLGMKTGDRLVSINGEAIETKQGLIETTSSLAGESIELTYVQAGQEITTDVTLSDGEDDKGYLGVFTVELEKTKYGVTAPIVGLGTAIQLTALTAQGLGALFLDLITGDFGAASKAVSGPVGVVSLLGDFGGFGFAYLIFFISTISLTLAVINAMPIPALDGGRWFIMTLFKVFKVPLNQRTEEIIHGTGFALLMLLIVLISIVDVNRFILK